MVNGPNGGACWRRPGAILNGGMRCLHLRRGRRGQAIVETALLFPILMFLTMGSADLGRIFYYSVAITNAAREAARQGTYWDPIHAANYYDDYSDILATARREVPSDVTLSTPTVAPSHCLTGSPSSWSGNYPAQPNTGFVYICFDGNDSQTTAAQQTVQVTILYNFQPITPLAQVVGADTIHVLTSTTMQVETNQ